MNGAVRNANQKQITRLSSCCELVRTCVDCNQAKPLAEFDARDGLPYAHERCQSCRAGRLRGELPASAWPSSEEIMLTRTVPTVSHAARLGDAPSRPFLRGVPGGEGGNRSLSRIETEAYGTNLHRLQTDQGDIGVFADSVELQAVQAWVPDRQVHRI
jgi:hypothetical protein